MKEKVIAIIVVILVIVLGFGFMKYRDNSEFVNPEMENQEVQNQEVQNQEVQNQEVQNQEVQNQEVQNQENQNKNGLTKEEVKAALVAEGEWRPNVAYNGDDVLSVSILYGSIIRYGGGINFYEDDTFYCSLTWHESDQEYNMNYGKYDIDTETKKITYTYNSGKVMQGTYEEVDGVITKIIYEESDYLDGNDYTVEFNRRTEEQKKLWNLTVSLMGEIWIPTSANIKGEDIGLTMVYGEDYTTIQGIAFDVIGTYTKHYVTSELDGIYEDYGFYWIDIENGAITYQLVKKEDDSRVDIIGKYEEENDKITKITFTENLGTENEIEVIFEPRVF